MGGGRVFGTFVLVFFGCGSVAAAVLLGAQVGVFQVAIVWGLGIATAIYLTGALSGAHLNPAVTCALATCGEFPGRRVAGYVAMQLAGAAVAAAVLHAMFAGPLRAYEAAQGIVRGAAGSEATAMIFGEYFPNPGGKALDAAARALVSPGGGVRDRGDRDGGVGAGDFLCDGSAQCGAAARADGGGDPVDGGVTDLADRAVDDGVFQSRARSGAAVVERAGGRVGGRCRLRRTGGGG